MKRLALAIAVGLSLALGSDGAAQESAKVQITVKISAKTASFNDRRLVVGLSHDNPLQSDRGDTFVARYIDTKLSHEKGKESVLTLTLGEKTKLNKAVQYSVTLIVFDTAGKQTHIGEKDGLNQLCYVLTNGSPSKVTIIVRPLP